MQAESGAVFSLPMLLNILYRGWRTVAVITVLGLVAGVGYGIVVKPLYRSTAQVRPGIVAFTDNGAPLRGWAREDVIHFFEAALFWQDMRLDPALGDLTAPPVITADFVPSTMQFMAGGDVITLTNLSRQPQRAVAVLERAMVAFVNQAASDSLSGDITLTIRGIEIRMDQLANDLQMVTALEERAVLEIAQLERELDLVGYEEKKVQLELTTLASENAWRGRAVETTLEGAALSRQRLADAEKMLTVSLASEQTAGPKISAGDGRGDPVTQVLKQSATREQAGRVGDLLLTVNTLSESIFAGQVKADSLRSRITATEQEIKRLEIYRDIVLANDRQDIAQKIADKRIVLNRELLHDRQALENDLAAERIKLDMVTPLERVGSIAVTDKPVRPRKLRAAAILTILAFFFAVFLVLVREYFQVNRAVITAPRRS